MKLKKLTLLLNTGYLVAVAALSMLPAYAHAEKTHFTTRWTPENEDIRTVLSLRAGATYADVGSSGNLTLAPMTTNHYETRTDWQTRFVWGAFAGMEMPMGESERQHWQLGLSYYQYYKTR